MRRGGERNKNKKIVLYSIEKKVFWLIGSLIAPVKLLAKKPALLLPALLSALIVFALWLAFLPQMLDIAVNTLILEQVPEAPLTQFLFYFGSMYFFGLLAMLAFGILAAMVSLSLAYCYAVFVRMDEHGNGSVGKACRETISGIGKIAGLLVFALAVALFAGFLLWLALIAGPSLILPGLIVLLGTGLLLFYLCIKLSFAVQAMGIEKVSVREALQASWKFSEGRFLAMLVFIIVIAVINSIINAVGLGVSDLVPDDIASMAVFGVFIAIAWAYSGLAMPAYYLKRSGKK